MQIAAIVLLAAIVLFAVWYSKRKKTSLTELPGSFRRILNESVSFYQSLDQSNKAVFEKRMLQFLARVRITGVRTTIEEEDKVFIAASAVIPIFGFAGWEYTNLDEVLLYPDSFNETFEQQQEKERPVLGMVGDGAMQRVMILSQPSLKQGFSNRAGKENTAIHEFVHLLDKTDGAVDGVPENLLSKQYIIPWIDLMHRTLKEMTHGHSDINPYGATNQAEFFAVVSEYFFERPDLLQSKHPELFKLLEKIFHQDPNASAAKVPINH